MIRRLLLACALVLCASPLAGARKKITVQDTFRFRSEPVNYVWAPDGQSLVWMHNGAVQSLKLDGSGPTELLRFGALSEKAVEPPEPEQFGWQNRRVRESKLQFRPNSADLLLIVKGDLFLWTQAGGAFRQLTRTSAGESDPKFSPDGKQIAFRRGNDLFVLDAESGKERQITGGSSATVWNGRLDWVYPEELDLGTAYWWAPDSKSIAYLQFDVSRQELYPHADLTGIRAIGEPQRYPKAGTPNADVRLGMVAATGGKTRWLELGDPRDTLIARVDWQPDSSGLFVQRLNRIQNRLDLARADARSAKVALVVQESDPAWVNLGDMLEFLPKSGEFLWSSERDGYRHLYLYQTDGSLKRQITSGKWEVTELSGVDHARRMAYFLATKDSPLERHLYRVSLNGGEPVRITTAAGTNAVSMNPPKTAYLLSHSSYNEPVSRSVLGVDGKVMATIQQPDRAPAEEYEILEPEYLQVPAPGGVSLTARLLRPAGFDPKRKYPAIVLVYGGPHSQTVRNSWTGLGWDQALAHLGFVVWQLDNRGSAGYGHAWESPLHRRLGKTELEDQLTGIRHLLKLGFVDGKRIGIYGWSYGGYMTLYSMGNAPDMFRAGIAGAPVTDWRNYDTIYTERYLGLPAENEAGYRDSSAVTYADKIQGALLMIHCLEDDNVLFQNSVQMASALQKAGKLFETMYYPQKTHGVTGPAAEHLRRLMTAFFVRELKPGE